MKQILQVLFVYLWTINLTLCLIFLAENAWQNAVACLWVDLFALWLVLCWYALIELDAQRRARRWRIVS